MYIYYQNRTQGTCYNNIYHYHYYYDYYETLKTTINKHTNNATATITQSRLGCYLLLHSFKNHVHNIHIIKQKVTVLQLSCCHSVGNNSIS